jgi:hypothetical protein
MPQQLAVIALSLLGVVSASQAPAHDMHDRGGTIMGFDQRATSHHFTLYQDGGRIEVTVNDPANDADLRAIRAHLPHIAMMFAQGDFDAPMMVHDSTNVPGTAVLAARRDKVRYTYAEIPGGGRVDVVTTDAEALAAIHAFLSYQIAEHKTGDSTSVGVR